MSNIRDIFERARKTSIREAVEATFTPEIRAALGLPQAEKAIVRYPNKTPLTPEPLPLGPVSPPEVKPLGIAPPVAPQIRRLPYIPEDPHFVLPREVTVEDLLPSIRDRITPAPMPTQKYGGFGIVDDNNPEYNTDSAGIYRKIVDDWYEGARPPREIQGLVEAMEIERDSSRRAAPEVQLSKYSAKGVGESPGGGAEKIKPVGTGSVATAVVQLPEGEIVMGTVDGNGVTSLEDGSRPPVGAVVTIGKNIYDVIADPNAPGGRRGVLRDKPGGMPPEHMDEVMATTWGVWDGYEYYDHYGEVEKASPTVPSDDLTGFLMASEGYRDYVYDANPPNGDWTIGWGYSLKGKPEELEYYRKNGITEAEARDLLEREISNHAKYVSDWLTENSVALNQNQFDALVSFTYNTGTAWITEWHGLRDILLSGDIDYNSMYEEFMTWTSGGLLTDRRMAELALFFEGDYDQN